MARTDNQMKRGKIDTDDDLFLNNEDSNIMSLVKEYNKGRMDLEEVRNDPDLPGIENIVSDIISDYTRKRMHNQDDEKFIRDSLIEERHDKAIIEEINSIKTEIKNNNINQITSEWVYDWNTKSRKTGMKDSEQREIASFIKNSLKIDTNEQNISASLLRKKGSISPKIKYISMLAAVLTGIFIFLRILLPSSDPETLFSSYYKPFHIVSPVTRGINTEESETYASAIKMYNNGDFQGASTGFSYLLLKNNSAVEPRFFLGITQLAMEQYKTAISLLSEVASTSGDYGMDATWYLGLTYLKTGEKEKAIASFRLLESNPGFYQERSRKLLRHLK